jgi:hypothetical protein
MGNRKEIAQIACDAMNALGNSVSALEDIKKRGKWEGMQEVALKEVQAVYRPFSEVYEHLRREDADWPRDARLLRIVNAARAIAGADLSSPPEITRKINLVVMVAELFDAVKAYDAAVP